MREADEAAGAPAEAESHPRRWFLPRTLLKRAGVDAAALERGFTLPPERGMSGAVLTFLVELQRHAAALRVDQLGQDQLGELETIVVHLLRIAAEAERREAANHEADGGGGGGGELASLKRGVDERLTDPLLSPGRIAAEFGMSVRKLHALFEPTGQTFGQHVLARRLQRARLQLSDPAQVDQSITDVAFGLGFNSLGTFYRAYGAAYGEPPGDTRARARAGRG